MLFCHVSWDCRWSSSRRWATRSPFGRRRDRAAAPSLPSSRPSWWQLPGPQGPPCSQLKGENWSKLGTVISRRFPQNLWPYKDFPLGYFHPEKKIRIYINLNNCEWKVYLVSRFLQARVFILWKNHVDILSIFESSAYMWKLDKIVFIYMCHDNYVHFQS